MYHVHCKIQCLATLHASCDSQADSKTKLATKSAVDVYGDVDGRVLGAVRQWATYDSPGRMVVRLMALLVEILACEFSASR